MQSVHSIDYHGGPRSGGKNVKGSGTCSVDKCPSPKWTQNGLESSQHSSQLSTYHPMKAFLEQIKIEKVSTEIQVSQL